MQTSIWSTLIFTESINNNFNRFLQQCSGCYTQTDAIQPVLEGGQTPLINVSSEKQEDSNYTHLKYPNKKGEQPLYCETNGLYLFFLGLSDSVSREALMLVTPDLQSVSQSKNQRFAYRRFIDSLKSLCFICKMQMDQQTLI